MSRIARPGPGCCSFGRSTAPKGLWLRRGIHVLRALSDGLSDSLTDRLTDRLIDCLTVKLIAIRLNKT